MLFIYGYRRYAVIPIPKHIYNYKQAANRNRYRKKSREKKGGVNKSDKISWKNTDKTDKKELKLKAL